MRCLSLQLPSLPFLSLSWRKAIKRTGTFGLGHTTHNSEHYLAAKKESPSRNFARMEEREGRCLWNPCRSRSYTGDHQLGFWVASTGLPNPPSLFVFLKLIQADFYFSVERSSSSFTSWKLVMDQDPQSARKGMICSSAYCVSSSYPYMLQ